MQFNEIVEKLKQGQSGVVDFKKTNNPVILTAASLEKAKENDISFLDNNSQLSLKHLVKESKASALLLPSDDDYIIEIIKCLLSRLVIIKQLRHATTIKVFFSE